LLLKEILNSEGQQFHQYQQNKQSPLGSNSNISSMNIKKSTTKDIQNPGPGTDRYTNVVELNQLMIFPAHST
jgi:hypothetical protein